MRDVGEKCLSGSNDFAGRPRSLFALAQRQRGESLRSAPATEEILAGSRIGSRVRRKIHGLNSARVQSEPANSVARCPWEIKWDD